MATAPWIRFSSSPSLSLALVLHQRPLLDLRCRALHQQRPSSPMATNYHFLSLSLFSELIRVRSTSRSMRKTLLGKINARNPTGSLRSSAEPKRPMPIDRASNASRSCPDQMEELMEQSSQNWYEMLKWSNHGDHY